MDGQATSEALQGEVTQQTTPSEAPKMPGWTAQLPDDLKANETLTRFPTVGDLGRAFLEADGRLAKSVPLLTEDATDEQRAEFYKRLGRPESPDGYDLPEVEGVSPDALAAWRQRFHEAGLTAAQAKALYDAYTAEVQAAIEARQVESDKAIQDAEKVLRDEWGDDYDAKLELARRVVVEFGGDEFKALLDASGLGNDPRVVKVFAAIGEKYAEDTALRGQPGQPPREEGKFYYPSMRK